MAFLPLGLVAQKTYSTKIAKVKFYSHIPGEDIEATNSQAESKLVDKTGVISFNMLIKGFAFENSLMQQHFNEKDYMDSKAFPKANFTGTITNIASVNFTKNGTYKVTVEGNLTIKGKTQKVKAQANLTIANGKLSAKSVFKIKPKAFGISADAIAENVEITVTCNYN